MREFFENNLYCVEIWNANLTLEDNIRVIDKLI